MPHRDALFYVHNYIWHNDSGITFMNFIADVHLGKLAKLLRMLGFDTLYNNSFTNKELLSIAIKEKRILLSKNNAFKNTEGLSCFIVTSSGNLVQLQQVL